jgi:rare lipoprotein A
MRPQMDLQARRACAALAAVGLSCTLMATDPLGATAVAGPDLPAHLTSGRAVQYGSPAVVSGNLGAAQARTPLALEYAPGGSSTWTAVAHTTAGRRGEYRLGARLARSGSLRVVSGAASTATAGQPAQASASLPVAVRAGLSIGHRVLDVLSGHRTTLAGAVHPAAAGGQVALQLRRGGGWTTVARTRTGQQGRFRLGYTPNHTGSDIARLSFSGDSVNAPAQRMLGRLNSYVAVEASYYALGGTTACGQQLSPGTLGVANKTLPCGTMVTLRDGGRSVRVPVIDRGPYVAGRDFDLTEATKNAVGFAGTGIVWATAS